MYPLLQYTTGQIYKIMSLVCLTFIDLSVYPYNFSRIYISFHFNLLVYCILEEFSYRNLYILFLYIMHEYFLHLRTRFNLKVDMRWSLWHIYKFTLGHMYFLFCFERLLFAPDFYLEKLNCIILLGTKLRMLFYFGVKPLVL